MFFDISIVTKTRTAENQKLKNQRPNILNQTPKDIRSTLCLQRHTKNTLTNVFF